jgi:hypothetical protein
MTFDIKRPFSDQEEGEEIMYEECTIVCRLTTAVEGPNEKTPSEVFVAFDRKSGNRILAHHTIK